MCVGVGACVCTIVFQDSCDGALKCFLEAPLFMIMLHVYA